MIESNQNKIYKQYTRCNSYLCDNCMIVDLTKMNVEINIVENLIKWLMPRVNKSGVKNKIACKHVWKWYVGFN